MVAIVGGQLGTRQAEGLQQFRCKVCITLNNMELKDER
jgi:hypothetical protein